METRLISMPFRPSMEETMAKLSIGPEMEEEFREVYDACVAVAQPKAVVCLLPVRREGAETIIGSERFQSRIMQVNMQPVGRAFPYAVSCGRELYELSRQTDDPLERVWVDCFSQLAMRAVDAEMSRTLMRLYRLGHTARMNPGSLPDFPITCQRALFRLLDGGADAIGLELTESCLMLPYKSVSGILYETEADYENCMLCPRENCPTRRAAYDAAMGEKVYHLQEEKPR